MSEQTEQARRRRYLVDGASQLRVACHIVAVMVLVGVLDAVVVYVISDPSVEGNRGLADSRLLLLAVHAASVLLGGAFLFWIVVKLTHRYAGPAFVMRRALVGMSNGDYGHRLSLRTSDYHSELAAALDDLRSEIAAREVQNARAVHRLKRGIDEQDDKAVEASLHSLGMALPTPPLRRQDDQRQIA